MLIVTKFGSGSPTVSPNPLICNYYLQISRTQIRSLEGKIRVDHIQSTMNPNKNELRHLYDFLPTSAIGAPVLLPSVLAGILRTANRPRALLWIPQFRPGTPSGTERVGRNARSPFPFRKIRI